MMMRSLSPLVPRFPTSPVPSISIDFAPVEEVIPEPPSPFAASSRRSDDDESLRSNHLLPPPAISPRARHMYHMQQQQAQQQSQQAQQQQQRQRQQGVDPARFESMLQFARSERPAASKQQLELRKEVAFKAHQSRQAERRRLFLSKIVALPSPTATATPVTPPESPAVFHFTLPSPGLVSPLALFETLDYDPTNADVRIEHVDFRARAKRDADAMAAITRNVKQSMEINGLSYPSPGRRQQRQPLSPALPSLAQISARLNATSNVTTNRAPVTNGSRLPAFLRKTDAASAPVSPPSPAVVVVPPPTTTTTTAAAATRLPAFLRSREQKKSPTSSSSSSDTIRPTPTPRSPAPPALSITPPDAPLPSPTTPSIAIFSPTSPPSMSLPSDDAVLLDERARHAKDMVDKLRRRVSAPAELTSRKDTHPILKVHGGF